MPRPSLECPGWLILDNSIDFMIRGDVIIVAEGPWANHPNPDNANSAMIFHRDTEQTVENYFGGSRPYKVYRKVKAMRKYIPSIHSDPLPLP